MERHYYLEYQGNSLELPVGETIVGRDVGCRLRFNDPTVSRRHLRFVRRQDELFVEDLNSSNGTLLNGRSVSIPIRIKDGDTIQVGETVLVLRAAEDEVSSSTVLLHERNMLPEMPPPPRAAKTAELRAVTRPMAIQQRCPRCGEAVTETDDACESCGFAWAGFRATSHTEVRKGVTRRRHDRCPVELQLVYVSSELEIEATTLDLSTSGVFVCSQVLDPVGTKCQLTILLDGGPPLEIRGIVRRVVEHDDSQEHVSGLGVEFMDVGPIQKSWLERVIAQQMLELD